MADFPDIEADNYSFTLLYNTQSFESPLTKAIQTASLAGDQWRGVSTFTNRNGTEARTLRAFILGLKGQTGRFNYTPPDLNQGGTLLGSPVIDGAGQLGDTIKTKGWDYPQDNLILAGDYLTVNSELKMVLADASTSAIVSYEGTNLMSSPFDPSGWSGAISDPDVSYTSVIMKNPSGEDFVGEFEFLSGTANPAISTYFPFTRGENIYSSILIKSGSFNSLRMTLQEQTGAVVTTNVYFDSDTGAIYHDSGPAYESKTTDMGDGFYLVELKFPVSFTGNYRFVTWMRSTPSSIEVGDTLFLQAIFFGLTGKYQGSVAYTGTNFVSNPFNTDGWNGTTDADGVYTKLTKQNPSGQSTMGLFEFVGGVNNVFAPWLSGFAGSLAGDYFSSMVVKVNTGVDHGIQSKLRNAGGTLNDINLNLTTEQFYSSTGLGSVNITDLGNGYKVIQFKHVYDGLSGDVKVEVYWRKFSADASSVQPPDVGSEFEMQAAYFGKNTDFPAIIDPADPNQYPANIDGIADISIAPPLRKSPSDLAPIEVEKPYMIAKLEDDEQTSFQVSAPVIYNASFSIVEVF